MKKALNYFIKFKRSGTIQSIFRYKIWNETSKNSGKFRSASFLTLIGGAEMTIILSDNNSRILTAPSPTPWRVEGG